MPVVEAVGLAVPNRAVHSMKIEAAMKAALDKALADGVRKPETIRKRMMAAQAAVKATLEGTAPEEVKGADDGR